MKFLKGCVWLALAGGAMYADLAFASCGDVGRNCDDDVRLARIHVVGHFNPFDVENTCFGYGCEWTWDDPIDENGGDSGGGSEPIPLPGDPPAPSPPEDLDENCGRLRLNLPWEVGGGEFFARICWANGEPVLVECQDWPQWGSPACPTIP